MHFPEGLENTPLVDGKALDYRFYTRVHMEKKAFPYRAPIGDYTY